MEMKSVFVGSLPMAERPKTVGLMQDVFAAGGDMAKVPVP